MTANPGSAIMLRCSSARARTAQTDTLCNYQLMFGRNLFVCNGLVILPSG